MDIGKRITHYRTQRGYTINKLANLSGVSQSYLRDVELGNKHPTVEFLSIICSTLKVSLKDFFDEPNSADCTDVLISKIMELNEQQKNTLLKFLESISI